MLAPRVEHQTTIWAFNLISRYPVDFRRRNKMATAWTGCVEGSQDFLEINLSAWHKAAILVAAKDKRKPFLLLFRPCVPSSSIFLTIPSLAHSAKRRSSTRQCTRLSSLLVGSVPHVKENCQSTREPPRRHQRQKSAETRGPSASKTFPEVAAAQSKKMATKASQAARGRRQIRNPAEGGKVAAK